MAAKEMLEAAMGIAREKETSIGRVLGHDRITCWCMRCDGKRLYRPAIVEQHLAIYRISSLAPEIFRKSLATEDSAPQTSKRPVFTRDSTLNASGQPSATSALLVNPAVGSDNLCSGPSISRTMNLSDDETELGFGSTAGFLTDAQTLDSGSASLVNGLPISAHGVQIDNSDNLTCANLRVYSQKNRAPEPTNLQDSLFLRLTALATNVDWPEPPTEDVSYCVPSYEIWGAEDLRSGEWRPALSHFIPSIPEALMYPVRPLSRPVSPAILDLQPDIEGPQPVDPAEDHEFYAQMLENDLDIDDIVPEPLDFDDGDDSGNDNDGDPSDDHNNGNNGAAHENAAANNEDADETALNLNNEPDNEPDGPAEAADDAFGLPRRLRNICIRTWVESVFSGATREQTGHTLLSHKLALEDAAEANELAEDLLECLPKMALTHRSLERCLGVNSDEHLRVYALCRGCGKRYTMAQICRAAFPGCPRVLPGTDEVCGYPVWEEKLLADGTPKRVPLKSFPFFLPAPLIERILTRPGVSDILMRRPHGNEDDPPNTRARWEANTPLDEPIGDISTAWGWGNSPVGMRRQWNPNERVYEDVPVGRRQPLALANCPIGLSLALNTDGFQTFGYRGHTSSGVFLLINNLPYHQRQLVENIILVAVIPGPGEPTKYEFDQIMEPLIDALIAFEQGVPMQVYNLAQRWCEEKLVRSHLALARLDYMARIKVCGHAGTRSEVNFCMYCHMRRSFLSVPEGFKDPLDTLDQKHDWLREPNQRAQEAMRERTGVIFTEFDRLGCWFGASMCPPDAMHTVHLGTTRHIIQSIILGPGMMEPRGDEAPGNEPLVRANSFLDRLVYPSFCKQKIPEFSRLSTGGKAETFRHLEIVLYAVLFEAWREGDTVPDGLHPRGRQNTQAFKFQQKEAKELLRRRRHVHQFRGGNPADTPTPISCVSGRSRRLILLAVIVYCRALKILLARFVTRRKVNLLRRLLFCAATLFTRLNYSLSPQWHYIQHLPDALLKFGSVYQFWVFVFERLNRLLVNTNHNNHSLGALETTMARGFLKRSEAYGLVTQLQSLPNPTRDDTATINFILKLMRNGPAHELQRGILDAVLAGEAHFRGQERIALATTSRQVDWYKPDHRDYWNMVMEFCSDKLGRPVYGYGAAPNAGLRLESKGSARCFPYVHHGGLRFGNDYQSRGFGSCYGYIEDQIPVLIQRIYQCTLTSENEPEPQVVLCAVIRRFSEALQPAVFPWDTVRNELQVQSWAFDTLQDPEVVTIDTFTGVFALGDIDMSYGHYWLTFSMQPIEPEVFDG